MRTKTLLATIGLSFYYLFAIQAFGQITTGGITGTVSDQTHAVTPGVSLLLQEVATGAVRTTATDASGSYTFAVLPPGIYKLTATLNGFGTLVQENIKVSVNEINRLDLTLQPASVAQHIEVNTEPAELQTESAAVGGVLENQAITELPLNGRDFIQLVALEPGANSTEKLPGGGISYLTATFGGNYIVNGAPSDGTSYLLDGIEMRDTNDTRVSFEMTVDAIQEFNFQSSNYSAAFGGASGGIINISSRSGTNQFHGSVWEFIRNDIFDARNYFNPPQKPPFRQNQFGGAIGGPIVRDKTFFFVSYEGFRQLEGLSQAVSVPTVAQRNGDFSADAPIYNPLALDPSTGLRAPFPGNQIPPSLFSPVAVKALNLLYPLPNGPGEVNNLTGTADQTINTDQVNARLDQKIGEDDSLFARATWVRAVRLLPFAFSSLPNVLTNYNSPAVNAVISESHLFSSRSVNQVTLGYNRHTQVLQDAQENVNINQELGITGLSSQYLGNPNIYIAGLAPTGSVCNAPNDRTDDDYTLLDNFSYTTGNQSFTIGMRFVRNEVNGQVTPFGHGGFTFNGTFTSQLNATGTVPDTGNAVADFLLGFPLVTNNCCITGSPHRNNRSNKVGPYFQDDWKVRPNLTLNLGLRWDYYQPLYDLQKRMDFPDLADAPNLVLLFAGKDGQPNGLRHADLHDFSPRVGFAYGIGSQTVIRGGFGIFYNPVSMVWGVLAALDEPFTDVNTFLSSSITPQLTLANPFPTGLGLPSTDYYGWPENLHDPYNLAWNLALERKLTSSITVSATYVGNKGDHLDLGLIDINQPTVPGPGSIVSRRLIPSLTSIFFDDTEGSSIYHGLDLKVERRFSNNLGFLVSYVLSHCIDDGAVSSKYDGSSGAERDPYDSALNRASCTNDERNRFVSSFVYSLPFKNDNSALLRTLVNNWSVQGILTLESGQPEDVLLPYDNSNTDRFLDAPDLVPGQSPNNGPKTPDEWFNVNAFTTPPPYTFGTSPRSVVQGPPNKDFDCSISKGFNINEQQKLLFKAEFFNLLNHLNLEQPGNVFGTPSFGVIGAALPSREIQFALKYSF
jgi:hypothetical protein